MPGDAEIPKKDSKKTESESDEDDDVVDEVEIIERPVRGGRQSVSAEAYGEWNQKKAFTPPVHPKTDEQKDRLRETLIKSFMFSRLDEAEFNIILGATQEVAVEGATKIITKGEDGDTLYVIETGVFECSIPDEAGNEKVVKTCTTGDVFGELSLLYNAPRAATVTAKENGTVWSLDRDTFGNVVKESAQNKRNKYNDFLAKVPLLSSMDPYERSQLSDALRVETVAANDTIVKQGEVGDKFYIVEAGCCSAMKDGYQVMIYGEGDYFGELALINNQVRAADVVAKEDTKLLSIDSVTFKRLLDVEDLVKRSEKYT